LPRGPEQAAARQAFLDGAWRRFATLFEKRLQTNQIFSPFFVGRSLTIADLKFYAVYEMFASGQLEPISINAFNDFPLLLASTAATTKIIERARAN
jgi:glutathione S-transferase